MLGAAVDMEDILQEPKEQDEHNGVHHNRRNTSALVGELHGAVIAGNLQQQPRGQEHEQDHTDDQGRRVHLGLLARIV